MIELEIPGFGRLQIRHIVMDYNGTLAVDGALADGVAEALRRLAGQVELHVITADTFGRARSQLAGLPCQLTILPPDDQARAKKMYIEKLGSAQCVAVGNGRNDRLMLDEAVIGILLVQAEGASIQTLQCADIICWDAADALSLFIEPRRLVATLRS